MFLSVLFSESNIECASREMISGNQLFKLRECASVWFDRKDAAFGTYPGCGERGVVADIRANVDYGHARGKKSGDKPSFQWLIGAEIYRALDPIGEIQFEL